MNRVKTLINKHGGTLKVAEKLGFRHAQTVSMWNTRKSIPIRHWPALLRIGFTKEQLLEAHLDAESEENEVAA